MLKFFGNQLTINKNISIKVNLCSEGQLACFVPNLTCDSFIRTDYDKDRFETRSFSCMTMYFCPHKDQNSTHNCDTEGMKVVGYASCHLD